MTDRQSMFIAGFEEMLFAEADAAARAASEATMPGIEGAKAMVAILLAVASVEARVGTWSAIFRESYRIDKATLRKWRTVGIPDVVKDILGRHTPPIPVQDVPWFNGLCAITKLRNQVAHYSPDFRTPGTWPEEIAGLISGKLIIPAGDASMDWTSRLLVGSVATQVVVYARQSLDGFMALAWRSWPDASAHAP